MTDNTADDVQLSAQDQADLDLVAPRAPPAQHESVHEDADAGRGEHDQHRGHRPQVDHRGRQHRHEHRRHHLTPSTTGAGSATATRCMATTAVDCTSVTAGAG